jgi:hypothetical protein
MNLRITNFLFSVISSQKSRVGAREARQWACVRFISVVWGCITSNPQWVSKLFEHLVSIPRYGYGVRETITSVQSKPKINVKLLLMQLCCVKPWWFQNLFDLFRMTQELNFVWDFSFIGNASLFVLVLFYRIVRCSWRRYVPSEQHTHDATVDGWAVGTQGQWKAGFQQLAREIVCSDLLTNCDYFLRGIFSHLFALLAWIKRISILDAYQSSHIAVCFEQFVLLTRKFATID